MRRVLNRLVGLARDDLRREWAALGAAERVAVRRALEGPWVDLIEAMGAQAAMLAADVVEMWAEDLGVRPIVRVAAGVDPVRASARLGWALGQADAAAATALLLDELVKQPYRSTVQNSAHASGVAWARVPTGVETCKWCLMLASRGAVYHSRDLARLGTNGKKYHGGNCDCTPALVRGPEDYPDGYDPDALYDRYLLARNDADSANPKKILAAWRAADGGN